MCTDFCLSTELNINWLSVKLAVYQNVLQSKIMNVLMMEKESELKY